MLENNDQPKPVQKGNWMKLTALAAGGGCALIACLGLVMVLTLRFLGPQIGVILSQIQVGSNSSPEPNPVNIVAPPARSHPKANANTMGDPKAPVKIVEYADFQCPFCLRYWQDTEPQIIKTYVATGKVFYEYRSVGAFIGPESGSAAEAAYCAGDQGKFWEYHDTLYSNWTGENVGNFAPDKLQQFALAVGLDTNKFNDCISQSLHKGQVQQDVADAKADGIQATPSFVINGKLIEGAQPFDVMQQEIESALKGK
jgi:protein-disulfide isomerase